MAGLASSSPSGVHLPHSVSNSSSDAVVPGQSSSSSSKRCCNSNIWPKHLSGPAEGLKGSITTLKRLSRCILLSIDSEAWLLSQTDRDTKRARKSDEAYRFYHKMTAAERGLFIADMEKLPGSAGVGNLMTRPSAEEYSAYCTKNQFIDAVVNLYEATHESGEDSATEGVIDELRLMQQKIQNSAGRQNPGGDRESSHGRGTEE